MFRFPRFGLAMGSLAEVVANSSKEARQAQVRPARSVVYGMHARRYCRSLCGRSPTGVAVAR